MKGFDDHLDNYGNPGPGDDIYPECEHTHKIGGRKFTHSHEGGDTPHSAVTHPDLDAPNQQPDDPGPGDDSLYPECEHTPPCTGDREDAPCWNQPREEDR